MLLCRWEVTVMSKEKINSKLNQAEGTVEKTAGKVLGDKKLESEGVVKEVAAKGEELVSDIKDTIKGTVDAVKDRLK